MNFVAVTSCPTGIAHSQMAAENLEQTAERMGHDIRVEIQGAMGTEDELSSEEIASADAVIIAADTSVDRSRFERAGVPVVKGGVKEGVNDAESLVEQAEAAARGEDPESVGSADDAEPSAADSGPGTASPESNGQAGTTGESGTDRPSPDQIGGDPRKGLFARLKRLFS
ncbi:PTS fructose transporter subunit IIB [Halomarina salina]|uniref:PTS fructose transporter subunit IIB n=1 Tax=Halomarina salina TaxID=1872699 RepID=A0ABD5RLR2_9EURY|nr:PTS fructose transporter subunit IIB [Halomarina salina]